MSIVRISHGLLALYLASLLALPKVQSPLVALVCLTAIIAGQWRQWPALADRAREGRAMLVPLAGYSLLIILQMLAGHLQARDTDQILMCALSAGVLLSTVPARGPAPSRWLLPAAAVGAIGAFALAAWQGLYLGIYRPPGHLGVGSVGSGAIKFGDLAVVLGLFSLWLAVQADSQKMRLLGVAGFAAALGAVALTMARGAVLGVAAGVLMLLILQSLRRRQRRHQHYRQLGQPVPRAPRWRTPLLAMLVILVLVGGARMLAPRFADIEPQYERFMAGDLNSEVGQRLALWGVAVRAGIHAPLTGVGIAGFGAEIRRQRSTGEVDPDAMILYEGAHNEYLSGFAGAGVPGLLVVMLFFWAPLWVGVRRFLRGQAPEASMMLVLLSSSFAVFSMTDSMFDRQISMLAYLLLASWLLAAGMPEAMAARRAQQGGADALTHAVAEGPPGQAAQACSGQAVIGLPGNPAEVGMGAGLAVAGKGITQVWRTRAEASASGGHPVTGQQADQAAVAAGDTAVAPGASGLLAGAAARAMHGSRQMLSVPGGLSVAIIAKNEAHSIARCLQSVAFADQVVVLDSGSTDDTVAIARSLGAEVEVTPDWPGFGPQKNRALARCRHRWVLSIDADEQVSPALAEEIRAVLTQHDRPAVASLPLRVAAPPPPLAADPEPDEEDGAVVGYWLRRSSRFCGQVIAHGLWGNDRVLRLFERTSGRFSNDPVHERLICSGRTRVLDGMLMHDSVDSLEDAWTKTRDYAFLGASMLRARGRGGLLRAASHAGWAFLRGYVLRTGFLDGRYGLTVARLHAQGTFWKYRWAALDEAGWQALGASFRQRER